MPIAITELVTWCGEIDIKNIKPIFEKDPKKILTQSQKHACPEPPSMHQCLSHETRFTHTPNHRKFPR